MSSIFRILVLERTRLVIRIGSKGVDGSHLQIRHAGLFHLPFGRSFVVGDSHRHAIYCKDGVEATRGNALVLFSHLGFHFRLAHFLHVGGDAVVVGISAPCLVFCAKCSQNIAGDNAHTLGRVKSFQCINTPHVPALHIILHAHGAFVVHTEAEHVLVVDGVDDGVGIQFVTEACSVVIKALPTFAVNGVPVTENHVFLEQLVDDLTHIAKLAAVALVEDQHHTFLSRMSTFSSFFLSRMLNFWMVVIMMMLQFGLLSCLCRILYSRCCRWHNPSRVSPPSWSGSRGPFGPPQRWPLPHLPSCWPVVQSWKKWVSYRYQ